MRLMLCAFVTFQEHITYLLTAIGASFGKIRAQEEPKSLPPDVFPGLQLCRNCFCSQGSAPDPAGELTAPPDPSAGLRGLLLRKGRGGAGEVRGRGREGRGKGEEGEEGRGGEGRRGEGGRGREGRAGESCALSQIPGSTPDKER